MQLLFNSFTTFLSTTHIVGKGYPISGAATNFLSTMHKIKLISLVNPCKAIKTWLQYPTCQHVHSIIYSWDL